MAQLSDRTKASLEQLQQLYQVSSQSVRGTHYTQTVAEQLFRNYINFVEQSAPSKGRLLDVGCGSGWSSFLLSQQGYVTTGVDLNATVFEPVRQSNLNYCEGSVLDLPFEDSCFDVVCTYQMLEHVPDPQKALTEMLRVLKPGGVLCIVGPNCLSVAMSLKAIFVYVWRNRPLQRIFFRDAGMPRHPCGNTLFEAIFILFLKIFRLVNKSLSRKVEFTMREPDLVPPFHGDNDACYLCNPIDLTKFLTAQRCSILKNGKPDRPAFTRLLAGGTWIAAQK